MHITLEADYAIRIVQVLAQNQRRLDAKTISEMTGVTLRFSLKILRKLVVSVRASTAPVFLSVPFPSITKDVADCIQITVTVPIVRLQVTAFCPLIPTVDSDQRRL